MKCLRNTSIPRNTGWEPLRIEYTLARNQLRCLGHVCQMSDNSVRQKFLPANLTMNSSRVLYADYYAIPRFFYNTRQSFEILSIKTTKNAILTYFRIPLDIKQQYLKSKYFVDVIENSFLFDFQITI